MTVKTIAGRWTATGPRSGPVSLRTLILIRWIAVGGQLAAVLGVAYGFDYRLPMAPVLAVILISALLNLAATVQRRIRRGLTDGEARLYLAYDLLQLAVLLFLTGGLLNPFVIMLLAPLTVSATTLGRRSTLILTGLTLACIALLAIWHYPLPGPAGMVDTAPSYRFGLWLALTASTIFYALYIGRVAAEARRGREALTASRLALAREQQVSAVGALAAAAAHELGTPLSTIAVVAKELSRELPAAGPLADDAALLLEQTERCRAILAQLGQRPENDAGDPSAVLALPSLIETAAERHKRPTITLAIQTASGAQGPAPLVRRTPELMHGLGNLVQNAFHFARTTVTVIVDWDPDMAQITLTDDGPGFPPGLLDRIGEPYFSTRGGSGDHMGLGIFIASTLLAQSGAEIGFNRSAMGGAEVVLRWKRPMLELS
ncbi:MAG: ActS/PrrB/RegB family redox-sensitive histidine kinase [Inquilinaceae bacterium]